MAARYSVDVLDDAHQLADLADDCRKTATQLADDDGLAYAQVLAARSDADRSTALRAAAEVVLAIAEVGAETTQLAERLAENGKPSIRGDARTGAVLAAAATRAAVDLVRIDVSASGDDAAVLDRARTALERASAAGQGSG